MNVSLSGSKTVVGPVTTSGDNVVVATRTVGSVEAPKTPITALHSPAEQAAYEKSLHPGLAEGWKGSVNVGFALTRGNSETKNLNIAFAATRKGFRDKLILYTNSAYATNDSSTASPHTTANAIGGGARYDHDLMPVPKHFRAALEEVGVKPENAEKSHETSGKQARNRATTSTGVIPISLIDPANGVLSANA